jgi:predicted ATP-grasp superfamily ATP-dependent carboligase
MTTNGATKLIGVTEQWVGHPSLTNSLFAYCGSIGPILLPEKTAFPIIKLGRAIAEQYQVEGVFGIDFLINADGVFPVDVNPRITASAEVFERWDHTRSVARPFNAVEAQLGHWRPASERGHRLIDGSPFACALGRGLETSSSESLGDNLVCGKAIVFNQTDSSITVAQRATDRLLLLNERDDEVSDVPTPKTVIHRDEPMVTVHAQGANRETVARKLIAAAERARSIFVD